MQDFKLKLHKLYLIIKPFLIIFSIIAFIILIFLGLDKIFGLNISEKLFNQIKEQVQKPEEIKKDETPLEAEVDFKGDKIELMEGFATLALKSNKEITLVEDPNKTLVFSYEKDGFKWYVLEADNLGIGSGLIKFSVQDESQNIKSFEITYSRSGFKVLGKDSIDPWPNTTYVADGDDLLSDVSKGRRLLNTYAPTDLIELKPLQIYTQIDGMTLREEAALNLRVMLSKMKEETGKDVLVASSYRSYNTQVATYSSYLTSNTQEEVDKFSARPGYSEHQLGTAVDFQSDEVGFDFLPEFDQSTQGKWLKVNSYKYGFVQSYPEGKTEITGYNYEAWHYRFIGIENAKAQKESGLTLIEWLKQK